MLNSVKSVKIYATIQELPLLQAAFFSALSADARLLIIGALDRDGIEHPALKWANSTAPQLNNPRFEYLQAADVYARIPNRTNSKASSPFMGYPAAMHMS